MVSVCKFTEKGWFSNKSCGKELRDYVAIRSGKEFNNKYCSEHGCRICGHSELKSQYQNPKKDFKTNFGEEVCSLECKNDAEKEHYQKTKKQETEAKQNIADKMSDFDNETTMEIKSIFTPFYEIIKEARTNELRKELLREQIKQPFEFRAKCSSVIEANSSLEPAEKEQWKKIYEKVSSWKDLITSYSEEKNFLVSLAKKYKDKEEQSQRDNTPKCKKCQLRREQSHKFPVGCEDWCKECINKKQREEQSPKDNNNNYTPLVNDSPSQDEPPLITDKDTSSTLSYNPTPTEDDNKKDNNGPSTDQNNFSNSRKSKDDSATSQFEQIVKYSSLIIIPAFGVSLIVYFLAKKKKEKQSNKVFKFHH